jgi:glycosyltransferase involved in cell wall biosynthesis
VQTHGVKSHFLLRLSGVWRSRPWVAYHHGYTAEGWRMRGYNQLNRWSLRAPAQVVTMCEPFKQILISQGAPRNRISVVHNSVGPDWFVERNSGGAALCEIGMSKAENERFILVVGRLSKEKGHADLLAALQQLNRFRQDMRLRLIVLGEGPEQPRLEQLVRALNLQHEVVFRGHVPDARPYYRVADILVIPSASEGSPNVLLEAMAAGLPVVATAVGGIPEIVTHDEHAMLVQAHDPAAMAQAIALVLSDSLLGKRLAESARSLAATKYSPEQRARHLLELYAGVIERSRVEPQY